MKHVKKSNTRQFYFFIASFIGIVFSQYQCHAQVLFEKLKGTYIGDTLNGLANGYGKATGDYTYEGYFIDGYPDGQGEFNWTNGNKYIGFVKKGKANGQGRMVYANLDEVEGEWKEGVCMECKGTFYRNDQILVGTYSNGSLVSKVARPATNAEIQKQQDLTTAYFLEELKSFGQAAKETFKYLGNIISTPSSSNSSSSLDNNKDAPCAKCIIDNDKSDMPKNATDWLGFKYRKQGKIIMKNDLFEKEYNFDYDDGKFIINGGFLNSDKKVFENFDDLIKEILRECKKNNCN